MRLKSLKGKLIGSGGRRKVYEHQKIPGLVIKEQYRKHKDYNRREYEVYQILKEHHPELLDWVVPIVEISDCGLYLVQERGEHCYNSDVPKERDVPRLLRVDCSGNKNWVMHKGKPKLCDFDHGQLKLLRDYHKMLR